MTAVAESMTSAEEQTASPSPEKIKKTRELSLRIKITAMFVALFTLVFAVVAFWVVQFSASSAQERLEAQLFVSVQGLADSIDKDTFAELIATVPAVPDPNEDSGFGYPDSPLYEKIAEQLLFARQILDDSGTYTWYKDPTDGKLYSAVSSGYLLEPQYGYRYKVPTSVYDNETTQQRMEQGLTETTFDLEFSNTLGTWISAYTPLIDSNGNTVGGVGQDIALSYVQEIRSKAVSQVLPVLLGIYVVLVVLVWLLASSIVRPIKRLTAASSRIAEGEYDLDVALMATGRLRDEISTLADSFAVMATKVAERERSLRVEVKRLKVEIDSAKRAESVSAIVDSDDFAQLAERAAKMRNRMREDKE